jgi:hypothetical protein
MTLHLTDEELIALFEDTTLPARAFTHAEHVRTAWLFVKRDGMPQALSQFSEAVKRFANAKGATGLYHETITWAYLFLIAQRIRETPTADWPTFAAAHPDLLTWKPSVLDRFYTEKTLWSDEARRTFVMPDRLGS